MERNSCPKDLFYANDETSFTDASTDGTEFDLLCDEALDLDLTLSLGNLDYEETNTANF
jgi:hypothetical protein